MKLQTFALALTLTLTFSTGIACSAESKKSVPASPKLAPADETFVKTAAGDGMAEVKLGTLAKQRAKDGKVKEFGEHMATDHGKANEELKTLATSKGIELSKEIPKKHEEAAERLMKLSGEEFDKAYGEMMVKDHVKAVSDFKKASTTAQDPEIKAFATKTLPTLEHHLEMARRLAHEPKDSSAKK